MVVAVSVHGFKNSGTSRMIPSQGSGLSIVCKALSTRQVSRVSSVLSRLSWNYL